MKRFLLASLAAVVLMTGVAKAEMKIGPQIAGNLAKTSTDGVDNRFGFGIGAVADWNLGDMWFFAPELMYFQQGAKSGALTLKYDGILLPLSFGAKFGGPELKWTAFLGPDLFFAMTKQVESVDFGAKSLEIGAHLGVGAEYAAMGATWLFNIRYKLGLTDILDPAGATAVKANGIVFSLGAKWAI